MCGSAYRIVFHLGYFALQFALQYSLASRDKQTWERIDRQPASDLEAGCAEHRQSLYHPACSDTGRFPAFKMEIRIIEVFGDKSGSRRAPELSFSPLCHWFDIDRREESDDTKL